MILLSVVERDSKLSADCKQGSVPWLTWRLTMSVSAPTSVCNNDTEHQQCHSLFTQRMTSPKLNRFTHLQHLGYHFKPTCLAAHMTISIGKRHINDGTLRRLLSPNSPRCRCPRRPVLNARRRLARRQWTTYNWQHYQHQQWRWILFSDETRHYGSISDGKLKMWSRTNVSGERQVGFPKHHGLMCYSWIRELSYTCSKMLVQSAGITPQRSDTLTRFYVMTSCPSSQAIIGKHSSMKMLHTHTCVPEARLIMHFMCQRNIRTMPWPALGPDLTFSEYFWNEIQIRLINVIPRLTTLVKLWTDFRRMSTSAGGFANWSMHPMYLRGMTYLDAQEGHTRLQSCHTLQSRWAESARKQNTWQRLIYWGQCAYKKLTSWGLSKSISDIMKFKHISVTHVPHFFRGSVYTIIHGHKACFHNIGPNCK